MTDLLANWEAADYSEIDEALRKAGFKNITLEEVVTSDQEKNNLTAGITLDGASYTDEECYLSIESPIVIAYYSFEIAIGIDPSQFIGTDYETVEASLKEMGFTDIETEVVATGWAKGNTVVGVTINNSDTFSSRDTFEDDAKIVIKFSSNNRVDITEILEDWENKDYEELVSLLTEEGFKIIHTKSEVSKDEDLYHKVSGISLNKEEYASGECYLQRSAPIMIRFYAPQIEIGKTAKQFEDDQAYTDVVKYLQSKGFTNIRLQRADDIGWFPIHAKEGTIKKFTIDGGRKFKASTKFDCDAEIIIVVHTKKGKGCEDITEIAK